MNKSIWEARYPEGSEQRKMLHNDWCRPKNYRVVQMVMNTLLNDEAGRPLSEEDVNDNIEYIKANCIPSFFTERDFYGIVLPHCQKYLVARKYFIS